MLNNDQIAELVQLSKQKNNQAFRGLYDATCDGLYFTLLKRLGNEQDAQDVLQETYVEAYKTMYKLKNHMAFVAWLNRIAYSFSMRYLNEKRRLEHETSLDDKPELSDDDDDFIPETALDKKESRQIISQIINELPAQQKTAVLLFYFEELSAKEIAEITDTNESNVFKRLHRARNTIKERFLSLQQKGVTLFTMPAFTILNTVLKEEANGCLSQVAKAALWGSISSEVATSATIGTAAAQKIIAPHIKTALVKLMATAAVGTAVVTGVLVYNENPVQPPHENIALAPPSETPAALSPESAVDPAEPTPPIQPVSTFSPEPERFAVSAPPTPAREEPTPFDEGQPLTEAAEPEPLQLPTSDISEEPLTEYVMLPETSQPVGTTSPEPEPTEAPPAESPNTEGSQSQSQRETVQGNRIRKSVDTNNFKGVRYVIRTT